MEYPTPPKEIYKSVLEVWEDKFLSVMPEVIYSVGILLLFFTIRLLAIRIAWKHIDDEFHRNRFRRGTTIITSLLAFFILFPVWLPSIRSVATLLGIFGTGVLLVSRDILVSIAGWVYILIRQPFNLGNRIEFGQHMGDVFDIRLLDTTLIEVQKTESGQISTGRMVHIPNNKIFTEAVANASKNINYFWNEIIVPVTAKSNWQKAQQILEQAAIDVLRDIPLTEQSPGSGLKPMVFLEYREKNILLTLRHQTDPRRSRLISDRIWREVLAKFSECSDIELG